MDGAAKSDGGGDGNAFTGQRKSGGDSPGFVEKLLQDRKKAEEITQAGNTTSRTGIDGDQNGAWRRLL